MLMLIKIVRMKGKFNNICAIDDDTLNIPNYLPY